MNDTPRLSANIFRMQLLAGLYSRVASQLGVERSHVRRVALGERSSARVRTALEQEMKRIDRKISEQQRKAA